VEGFRLESCGKEMRDGGPRLPLRVLTAASAVLSSGALPKKVILSDLLPIVRVKSRRAI
jgi:hypothetical protein